MKLFGILIIIFLYYFYIEKLSLAWGNYIDACINSSHPNKFIRDLNFWLHTGFLKKAQEKFNIRVHLPPQIQLNGPSTNYSHDNHIRLPLFLRQTQIIQYIKELQLKRTAHLNKDWSKYIIVHMRLSDVPFFRHPFYKLYKLQWYRNAIQIAQHFRKNCKVLIVCNLTHKNKNYQNSKNLLDLYAENLNCEYVCNNSEEQDIHCFMNCAVLISTISSFSFYAGLCARNIWITTTEIGSIVKLVNLRTGIIYLPPSFIPHENIKNYNDVKEIKFLI